MARRGWSTSNYLRNATVPVTAAPLTLAGWAKTSSTGVVDRTILWVGDAASAYNRNVFMLRVLNSDQVGATTGSGSAHSNALSSTTHPVNTWFHACAVFASATDRRAFLDGGGKGTETTSRVPSGIDRMSIGVGWASSVSGDFSGTTDLAELGIWNVALSDEEVAILALGVSPLRVRPESLVAYWPLGMTDVDEQDLVGGYTMSEQGTLTVARHPRVLMPKRKLAA